MSEQSESPTAKLSRRDLFRAMGFATGGAMLLGLPNILMSRIGTAEAALEKRSFATAATATLELDGQFAGGLAGVEGGGLFADIVAEPLGQDTIQRKRTGPVRFEDIVLDVALGAVEKSVSMWIADTLTKGSMPKSGAISYGDMNSNEIKRLEFTGAILSEVAFSEADGREARDAASVRLRLVPQSTRLTGGKGKSFAPFGMKSKQLSSANFRFNVQGLEPACKRIVSVSGVAARRAVAGVPVGQDKFRQAAPAGVLDCSTVRILLSEMDAGPFYAWFDDMVIKGNPGAERGGLLEWLDPMLKNALVSVQLGGLGIVRYQPEPTKPGTLEKMGGLVAVDMYCETMNVVL